MKHLLFSLTLFICAAFSAEYSGTFVALRNVQSHLYEIEVDAQGACMYSYVWAELPYKGYMAIKNLAELCDASATANNVKIKVDANQSVEEFTVYSVGLQSEFFVLSQLTGWQYLLRIGMGSGGAIVIKVWENGGWRYHPNGESFMPLFVPSGADNKSSAGYTSMRSVYYDDQDASGLAFPFSAFLQPPIILGYPLF